MRFYYGEKNADRILDEIEFWKRQEAEHTVVIRELDCDLEHFFVRELERWENEFSSVEGITVRYMEIINRSGYNPMVHREIIDLLNFSLHQSQEFIMFLDRILAESNAIKNNQTAGVVINHIRRESEYFIGIGETALKDCFRYI